MKKYKYITYCTTCKLELRIDMKDAYFYKAKPYCYNDRNKQIIKDRSNE